ncbi:MAG: hypothetical protein ABI412_03835 [Sphingomicrobium sp.]
MRKLLIVSTSLLLAACATAPQTTPTTPSTSVNPVHHGATLIGLSATDLVTRFGQPAFRLKEGPGTKLQWRSANCVLDAYLYPRDGNRGDDYVTHVDTRRPSGDALDFASCVNLLAR